jgi:hypothetical protein
MFCHILKTYGSLVLQGSAVHHIFFILLVTSNGGAAGGEKNAPQGWGRYHSRETGRNLLFERTGGR